MKIDHRIELLLEILDRSFNKTSWHGPNLTGSIRGIDAKTAARSIHGRKSIWQQVLHAAYWKQRALNKLVGTQPFPRKGSNWFDLPKPATTRAWRDDVKLLQNVHTQLRAAVAKLDPARLKDLKLRKLIYGVAMHDVYHAGQINLLKRMLKL